MDVEHFIVLDRILAVDVESGTLEAEATVPIDGPLFEGHFPGRPVFPGNLQTEILAQALGVLAMASARPPRAAFLIGVDKARFRYFVEPGARAIASARLNYRNDRLAAGAGVLRVDGRTVAEASILLGLTEFPNEVFRQHLRERLASLGLPRQAAEDACHAAF